MQLKCHERFAIASFEWKDLQLPKVNNLYTLRFLIYSGRREEGSAAFLISNWQEVFIHKGGRKTTLSLEKQELK